MRPSKFLGIKKWASRLLGLKDEWTSIQFDNAVSFLGVYIENKLNETTKQGRPKYKLEDLLADAPRGFDGFVQSAQEVGAIKIRKARKK